MRVNDTSSSFVPNYKEPIKKQCPECGTEFETIYPKRQYCNPKCANANSYRRRKNGIKSNDVHHMCPICSSQFTGRFDKRYCSDRCLYLGRKESSKANYHAKYKHDPESMQRRRRSGREQRQRFRRLVFEAYGGAYCKCCGEAEEVFLTMDHINGGGRQHRMQTRGHIASWLKARGFPPGYQVLCFNCNAAKGILGQCPHQVQAAQFVNGVG